MKISEPKFLLKEPKSDKKTLISLIVRFNDQRLVYSTGETVLPENWDFNSQRAKTTKRCPENSAINHWLGKIENQVQAVFRDYKIDGITPTPKKVKEELSNRLNDKPKQKHISFFQFIESFIEQGKSIKTIGTLKNYKSTLRHLKRFGQYKKIEIDFDDITIEFYNYLVQYFTMECDLAQNTISRYIKDIKVFLNAATEAGINTNLAFKSKMFKKPTENVVKIYLTIAEIEKLYALDLSNEPRLDKARDLFIIGCFTGLRFSDFSSLSPESIEGELIKIKTQKTGEFVSIPFKGKPKKIFEKYNGNFPRAISNQKMNQYLKELGEKAGLDDVIIIRKLKNGSVEEKHYKKYELLTTHCARRSFATNAYIAEIPSINIMKITGHKSEKVFLGYIRFSQDENALKLKEHSFFNN